MEIDHFSHKHPLILLEDLNENRVKIHCYGCQQPISGTPSYKCSQCSYFSLHKDCAQLPHQTNHPLHLHHPLTLLPSPPYPRNDCSACRRPCNGFTYNCSICDFNLDLMCAFLVQKIELNFHEHPLIPIQRPALFLCDACGIKHEGSSYQCGTCQFWVNQKCASLMGTIKHSDHDHFLSLTYSLPYEDYRFKSYCDICSKKVNKANWVYCCAECKYCAHVNCATSKSKLSRDHKLRQIDQKIEAKELEGNLICLPLTDESVNGIPNFTKPAQMYHVCHPHPLYFADMQINDGSYSESKLLVCDGCSKPISAPLYRCTECNFSLHECCAKLPIEVRHPLHLQHPLILNRWRSGYSDPPSCQSCKMRCNGVLFSCLACNFFLDIECALLQGLIVHEAHKHAPKENFECSVCCM